MKRDCTDLFLSYREIARLVWNLEFWPNPKLREWDSVGLYKEVIARLFEGMIVLSLGYQGRIETNASPGDIANFIVRGKYGELGLLADKNFRNDPAHTFDALVVRTGLDSPPYELKFLNFFDWDDLAARDFRFFQVVMQRLDDRRDLVGHLALVEVVYMAGPR